MYWFRIENWLDIALYLLLACGWALGGWLLVTHYFRLRHVERIVCGLAVGFLLFISLSNLFAHFLPLPTAFWLASIIVLVAGLWSAWRSKIRTWLSMKDFRAMFLIVGLLGISILFTLILRGEALFDEYLHLPLISIMAAGDIPPHFYLNPAFNFAYHYGIQVFSASLVRLAGFFPWSAWDISRAVAIAFTLVLGWLWVRRLTRSRLAAWLGCILFTFGGGARWLLLLLPSAWQNWISKSVDLVGTGLDTAPTLVEALHRTWVTEGAGTIAFPFAFHNGIFVPVFFTLGSTGALPFMTVLLLLLLAPRGRFSIGGLIIWAILFSNLALSAEHLFAVTWAGVACVAVLMVFMSKRFRINKDKRILFQWGIILILSALISLIQGGFVTETARNLVNSIAGIAARSYNARGFSIRWPPGLLSAHLGKLSIVNPGQFVALLAELGPALIIIPLVFIKFRKKLLRHDLFTTGLTASVAFSLVFPFFFQYEVDRSLTRMPATGLWTVLVLGFPILWFVLKRKSFFKQIGAVLVYVSIVLAGIVIFRVQLNSLGTAQYTYYIDGLDARYAVDYWNKFPQGTQILDRVAERSVTLFGRITRASSGIYEPLPDWKALISDPEPHRVAAAGYDYIYMDNFWWRDLTAAQQDYFHQPCIDIKDQREQDNGVTFRFFVDVRGCR